MWRDIAWLKGHKVTLPHSGLAGACQDIYHLIFTVGFMYLFCPEMLMCLPLSGFTLDPPSVCQKSDLDVFQINSNHWFERHHCRTQADTSNKHAHQSWSKCMRLGVWAVGCMWKNKCACSSTAVWPAETSHCVIRRKESTCHWTPPCFSVASVPICLSNPTYTTLLWQS